ncbi:MAG: formate dehydrogenase accessory sulfurtransferase FdhD [Dermatophilaceae bacterium]
MTTRVPRVRVDTESGALRRRPDVVVVEEPLEIRVGSQVVTTTMRTPGDDFDLALGYLLTEGLLSSVTEVARLMHCTDTGADGAPTFNVVQATVRPGSELRRPVRERAAAATSGCGICGAASVEAVRTSSGILVDEDPVQVAPEVLARLPESLRARQPVFDRTGGVHAAGLATPDGELLAVREDVGRHNAVDKLVGSLARNRELPLAGTVLVVSSRAGFEIVQKAAVAGIPVVLAVGAPTSLAVAMAVEAGMTLAAFARPPRFSLYSRPDRVTGTGSGLCQTDARSSATSDPAGFGRPDPGPPA